MEKKFFGEFKFFSNKGGGGGIINTGGLVPLLYYYLINKSVYYQIDKSVFLKGSHIFAGSTKVQESQISLFCVFIPLLIFNV